MQKQIQKEMSPLLRDTGAINEVEEVEVEEVAVEVVAVEVVEVEVVEVEAVEEEIVNLLVQVKSVIFSWIVFVVQHVVTRFQELQMLHLQHVKQELPLDLMNVDTVLKS